MTPNFPSEYFDPSDKDAVIRARRIEKNNLITLIDSVRNDAQHAHRDVDAAANHRKSHRLDNALRALENIIESTGRKP